MNITNRKYEEINDGATCSYQPKGIIMAYLIDSKLKQLKSRMTQINEDEFFQMAEERHGLNLKLKKTDKIHLSQTLRQMEEEPREEKNYIVENMFEPGQLILLAGMQKSAKSFFQLDLLLGIAGGGKISNRFNIKESKKVLLIDSEMPKKKNLDRIDALKALYQNHEAIDNNFSMVCLKETGERLYLSTEAGQACVENELQATKANVLAIDNLGGVIPDGAERRETEWRKVHKWVSKLNSKGITVILVHHKNKNGEVGGTSFILRDIDLSLSIQRPKGWSPADGNIIELHFADVRYLSEDQLVPFSIKYHTENGQFKRDLNNIDPESGKPLMVDFVTDEEKNKYNLSELEIRMLTEARNGEPGKKIKAADFKNSEKDNSTTISNSFKKLVDLKLLVPEGKKGGRKYFVPYS